MTNAYLQQDRGKKQNLMAFFWEERFFRIHPKDAQKSHIDCNPIFQCLECKTDNFQIQ